ncbi:MAG: class I SAM-dependent methyltransferase [Gammaproteobacteria bacterium]|nr:class I SAM-dependent methyltransferase [Gammaproteobacteria bacterium]
MTIQPFFCSFWLIVLALLPISSTFADDENLLASIINSEHRSADNRARDSFRHPLDTLQFFGIKSDMTILEVWPGKGWYSEILAPYSKHGGGHFIAAGFPLNDGPQWRQDMQRDYQDYLATLPTYYDQVKLVELGPPSFWTLGEANSVDAVLTFRNVHNWLKGGYQQDMFRAFYQVLKPGGVLGVVEHRAAEGTDLDTMKQSGYITEQLVIEMAEQAGFVLEQKSDINANPNDTKDYSKGVWTLPPTLRLGDENKAHYLAIGESDRMTLKFRKK